MIGTTISHYQILEKLGEGGMGVVYKAQDTKLDRFAALKFLPPHVAASNDERARFLQEAKAVASLAHPNICTIHSVEEEDGKVFIVMEYVEGKTLKDMDQNIGLKQAIEIGIQVADGLAAAHEKGIVHRDIKPDNIMVRKDGRVQIMDFGLAKLKGVSRLTKEGSTVGTAGYMSPEQVQGQETDHRTDIFSLGVVLYEMIAGQSPFKAAHETAIAYEIVNVDPEPISAIKPEVDPQLESIILDCLEKDPKERCQSVAEVARDLRRIKRESSRQRLSRVTAARPAMSTSAMRTTGGSPVSSEEAPSSFSKLPWVVAIICFLGMVMLGVLYFRVRTGEGMTIRTSILPPEKEKFQFFGNISGPPVISPDGKHIVFAARDSSDRQMLYLRSLDETEAHPLPGTEAALHPFWSPDNQFIGFTAQGKLKKVGISGGSPVAICSAADSRGGSWSKEGAIVFSPGPSGPLFMVSASGGTPTHVTALDSSRRETTHRWPFFLPDGKHFLFFARTTTTGTQGEGDAIRLGSIDGKTNSIVMNVASNGILASGHLLYVRGTSLVAQKFSTSSFEPEGEVTTLVQDIAFDPSISRGLFSASENGLLIYQTGHVQVGSKLTSVDRSGKALGVIGDVGEYIQPRISPDNRHIAVVVFDQKFRNNDLWIIDIKRGLKTRFTFDPAQENLPIWSPDGEKIVFASGRKGNPDLYIKSASGAASEELLLESSERKAPSDWSPDGRFVAYTMVGKNADIWILPMDANGRPSGKGPFPFLATEFNEFQAVFSPDGHWIAYTSDESGQAEVYLRPFPGPGGKFQVSSEGGTDPFWRRDGKEIYYISWNDSKLMSAGIAAKGTSVEVNNVHPLFAMHGTDYDVMRDGTFILSMPLQAQLTSPLTLVVNWDKELKKR
jgi:serine/threonine protein kinase